MGIHRKRIITTVSLIVILIVTALYLTNCGGGGGGTAPTTNCGVTLTSLDFPNVGVCANCDVDATSDTLKNYLAAATSMTLLHKTYTGDSDIPFICGKEGTWDPSDPGAFDDDLQTLEMTRNLYGAGTPTPVLELAGVFICNDGFGFDPGKAGEGLHGATTWRGEITFTDGTSAIRVRLRFTVTDTGGGADQTLASLGISASDVRLQDGDGNQLNTVSDVRDLFAADPTNITIKVVAGSTTYITATGGVICAQAI